jgi:hypothetical protein
VDDKDIKPDSPLSPEAVETLVWLAGSDRVNRRGYTIMSRLRRVRDSDDFATLPEDLRERVREALAEHHADLGRPHRLPAWQHDSGQT